MENLKKLLFAAAFAICVSATTVSAQKDQGKKPPPKNPPVVVVGEKPGDKPKQDKPKEDRKKPQAFMFFFKDE